MSDLGNEVKWLQNSWKINIVNKPCMASPKYGHSYEENMRDYFAAKFCVSLFCYCLLDCKWLENRSPKPRFYITFFIRRNVKYFSRKKKSRAKLKLIEMHKINEQFLTCVTKIIYFKHKVLSHKHFCVWINSV